MTDVQARVLAVANDLIANQVRPTARAIFEAITGRDRPSHKAVENARQRLVKAGLWPGPVAVKRPSPPQPRPGPRPARSSREYLGPFAEDAKKLARLRRTQRRLVALSPSPRERTDR